MSLSHGSLFLFHLLSKVVGHGRLCSAVSPGPDLVIWPVLHQRVIRCLGVPLHHLQHVPGHVYLHLPLPASEESKCFLKYIVSPELQQHSILARSARKKVHSKKKQNRSFELQVRREYSKCLRHTYCCSGITTESSHSSTKTSTTRTSARYSSGTQVQTLLTQFPLFSFPRLLMRRSVMRHISYWNEMKLCECFHLLQYTHTQAQVFDLCFFLFSQTDFTDFIYDGLHYIIVNHSNSCVYYVMFR